MPCDVTWRETLGAKTGVLRTIDVRSSVDADGRCGARLLTSALAHRTWWRSRRTSSSAPTDGTVTAGIDLTGATLDAPGLRLVKQPGVASRADMTAGARRQPHRHREPFTSRRPVRQWRTAKTTLGTMARIATLDLDGVLPPARAEGAGVRSSRST